jgi:hypothetical protein
LAGAAQQVEFFAPGHPRPDAPGAGNMPMLYGYAQFGRSRRKINGQSF